MVEENQNIIEHLNQVIKKNEKEKLGLYISEFDHHMRSFMNSKLSQSNSISLNNNEFFKFLEATLMIVENFEKNQNSLSNKLDDLVLIQVFNQKINDNMKNQLDSSMYYCLLLF